MKFVYEYTDMFEDLANYCWVKRGHVHMPELTHYGYDGSSNYVRANKSMERELVKKVKAELGLTGARAIRESWGETIVLRFPGSILFIDWVES